MPRKGLHSRMTLRRSIAAGVVTVMSAASVTFALAADKLIEVQWNDPEIKNFVASGTPSRSLGPTADDQLSKLKLPVLAFESTPGVVQNTFRLGPRPEIVRDVVMDEENPVWYQIVERYGDVTVSVSADLRIQHVFPETYVVYEKKSPGAAAQSGPTVSVFDDRASGGEEGYLAEYTINKFGVPYTVTVECTAEAKEECRDTTQISKDSELLKLIRADPPSP